MSDTDPSNDSLAATEQRLRSALAGRAAHVDAVAGDPGPGVVSMAPRRRTPRALWLAPAAVAAAVMVIGVAVLAARVDEGPQVTTGGAATSTVPPTTSTSGGPPPLAPVPTEIPAPSSTTATTRRATTTTLAVDRTIAGWPAAGSTRYPTAKAAATAFSKTVLGFTKPTFKSQTTESVPVGGSATVTITARPTAGASTSIKAVRNGSRSWVVQGATSNQGSIDRSTFGKGRIEAEGKASAFEATVSLMALTLDGKTLGEAFTMGGSSEQLPYKGGVSYSGGPAAFLLVGEGDASGEGKLVWACVVLDPALR